MKTTRLTAVTPGVRCYESPEVSVAEIRSEGILCASFETWNEEELDW